MVITAGIQPDVDSLVRDENPPTEYITGCVSQINMHPISGPRKVMASLR
jgi:hypothetical protein